MTTLNSATVYLHPLGCAKNTVNSEQMLALLVSAGYQITANPEEADAAIVNTCGFIDSAKAEAIDIILQLAALKEEGRLRALIVAGCLAQRYHGDIPAEIPEVDAVLGVGSYTDIVAAVDTALARAPQPGKPGLWLAPRESADLDGSRVLLSPPYWAWLRIAEGCDNRCAYCAIPEIRGPFRSRTIESIVEEAKILLAQGAKELILIAQDTTRYGLDRYGRLALLDLVRALEPLDGLDWLRIHYLYPDEIDDALLEHIAASDKILHYFDIPIQHIAGPVLAAMNRRGDGALIRRRIAQIRALCPDSVIRTSLIVGFPGETQADFEELYHFLQQNKLERVGIFCYSQEEGTAAAAMAGQVPEEIKRQRQESLYALQQDIMEAHGESLCGKALTVLCCGIDEQGRGWGRSFMDSPDVDGAVFFEGGTEGAFSNVRILWADGCDLYGELV